MLETIRRDTAYAVRALTRSPVFTLVAILSVAIGVGATTAIVTIGNALLFKPAPGIGNPERLVNLGSSQEGSGFDNFSYPNFLDYRTAKSLSGLSAIRFEPIDVSLAGPNGGEAISAGLASGNLFEVLQTRPAVGRFFVPEEDDVPGANPAVVLSHEFWSRRFSADPGIVGKSVTLNARAFTVIGVAPAGFHGPTVIAPDIWVTISASTLLRYSESLLRNRLGSWIMGIGRLAPGVSIETAQAELSAIARRIAIDYPSDQERKHVRVLPVSVFPGNELVIGGFMAMLLAIAGLVLAVASTNVAGMLLARATMRQREIAVRLALGASRKQLIAQLVTESLLLFLAAGAAGVVMANWLVGGLMALVPKFPLPVMLDPVIDWRVLVVALAVSLTTGLATGVIPALQTTRPDLVPALKSDGGGAGRRHRLRGALLVAQIAFSMLLLIVGGLFGRALVRAQSIDPGFDPHRLHIASLDFRQANYDSIRGVVLAETLLESVRAMPGVESATLSAVVPLSGSGMGLGDGVQVDGVTPPAGGWRLDWNIVSPGYFNTMRMPLVRGRDFTDADRRGSAAVAVMNEHLAGQIWPGQDALGRTFRNGGRVITVVGIAKDSKYRSLGEASRGFLYVPLAQNYRERTSIVLRSTSDASPAADVKRLLAQLDRNLPIVRQESFETHAATSLFPQRIAVYVAGSLGGVALLLALLGIYGVTAFSVAQRTREIGVRVALGADRRRVVSMVLRQGLGLAGVGVLIGAVLGGVVTRVVSSLLYGVGAIDSIAFLSAGGLLALAALVASWVPAMRAAAVDPVIALRAD